MQKKLIAVAVAGAMFAPIAMAEVSLSGALQAELVNIGGDGVTGMYVTDGWGAGTQNKGNAGAIALTASEELGGGLKGLARYSFNVKGTETGIDTRDSYLGLSGGFGTVLAGRLNHPYKTATMSWDPFASTFLQARFNGGMSDALHGSEISNALAYANSFGDAKVVAAMVFDEAANATGDATNGKHVTAFSVNAPVGPVEVAFAYANASEYGNVQAFTGSKYYGVDIPAGTAAGKNASATKIGVKWVAGDLSVAGELENLDKGLGLSGKSGTVMWVSGSYKMADNTLSASYGSTDKNVVGNADGITYLALGANHAFSKTTRGYVGYRSSDAGTVKETALGAGMRVNF